MKKNIDGNLEMEEISEALHKMKDDIKIVRKWLIGYCAGLCVFTAITILGMLIK